MNARFSLGYNHEDSKEQNRLFRKDSINERIERSYGMKRSLGLLLLVISLSFNGHSQPRLVLNAQLGGNYIFSKTASTQPGVSPQIGCGLLLGDEKHIQFRPRLYAFADRYRARLQAGTGHINDQVGLGLDLQGLLPLGKRLKMVAGIFTSYTVLQENAVSQNFGNGMFVELVAGADPRAQRLQGGMTLGLSYWLGKSKRWSIDLLFRQHLSSVFTSSLEGMDSSGTTQLLFPQNAKPTTVMIGINCHLGK